MRITLSNNQSDDITALFNIIIMSGIVFQVPYFGRISLRPQIYIITSPISQKGEKYFQIGNFSTSLNAYKKSLLTERDTLEVRNNIAACLLLLGDQYQAFRIFQRLKGTNLISIFNTALTCAAVNSPKEGLNLLDFEIKDPVINALKGILFHLNGDSVKAFEYLCESYQTKNEETENILKNIRCKFNDNEKTITFSRGKEKVHEAVKDYLHGFFLKFTTNKKLLNITSPIIIEDDQSNSDPIQSPSKKLKRGSSSTMILKNSKLRLKRMINPPQKRIKNLSPISPSPGFKSKEINTNKRLLDISKYIPPKLNSGVGPIDIEVDVEIDKYKYLAQQSLEYISTEYNLPNKNIEALYILLKSLKFFSKHKAKIVKEFIRLSTYERFSQGEIILKEGDPGIYIYIIISGSVVVTKSLDLFSPIIIASLYDGDVLGEYSFIRKILDSKPSTRQATCVASEFCHLIRLNNSDISDVLEAHIDLKNEHLEFIKSMQLFQNITPIDLALLANTISCKQYEMDSCILNAGDVPECMHIVYRGRVRIKYLAKKTKYSQVLNAVQYSIMSKDLWITSGNFFGQRALLGKKTPANYAVFSDSISYTSIIFITKTDFEQLFYPIQQHLLKKLEDTPELDLKVPEEYSYL